MTVPDPEGSHRHVAEGPAAWLARLGTLTIQRPPPSLEDAVAAAGGALVAGGTISVAGDRWASGGSSVAVLLTATTLAVSVLALVRSPGSVQVAAVAASGFTAPALAFFLSAGSELPSIREVALLTAMALAGLYLVGPSPGHTFHLALLVAAGWLFALSLTDAGLVGTVLDGFAPLGEVFAGAGVVSMVVGGGYVAAGWWLHAAGLKGMATPFLAVGCLALALGAFFVARDGADLQGAVLAVAGGMGLSLVGGRCRRRGTTWIGVGLGALGLLGVVDALSPHDAVVAGLLLVGAGVALVAVAPLAASSVGEGDGNGYRPPRSE